MKIGFYSPYLDALGGGERYCLTLASHWSGSHNVELFWDDASIIDSAKKRLNIDLSKVKITRNIFRDTFVFKKLFITRQYDLIFFLSDGSVPTSLAKHNILHFQMPFASVYASPWKFSRYDAIVCNSSFTKNNLDPALQNKAIVIYPPVATHVSGSNKKEKIILTVGRFHPAKKQDVLIEAFKKMAQGWKLICIGGLLPADRTYFESLQKASDGYPIALVANGSFDTLQSYYKKATIYWHATGCGEQDPQLQEHFGISTVEAMAHGCIPVVYNGGGLVEIITEDKSGFLWNTPAELLEKTEKVLHNPPVAKEIRQLSITRSRDFDEAKFFSAFDELLTRLTS